MDLTILDHVLVAMLFIVIPVLSVTDDRKFKSQLGAGRPNARLVYYRSIMAWSWGLTLVVAALWMMNTRGITQLGFGFETGWGFWIGLALTILVCALMIYQLFALRRDPEKLKEAAAPFESVKDMLPHSDREAKEFAALSITAGITEEIIYRGYLMLYISAVVPVGGMWPAAFLSSLAFGLAMAGLYLLTGSIWLLIVLHAVIDLVSGSLGRAAFAAGEAAPETD
ncbi:MAG: CPBP family intramembrane metalloprotease [Planctomycetota bacterium]|nr:CPBP family intramembrane metalloprotease [Planctomycetota bacterium]